MSLSVEERATYTSKIDSILATSDLATVSVKKIRQSLQEQTDSDISQHKNALKDLIRDRFASVTAEQGENHQDAAPTKTNGVHARVESSQASSPAKSVSPAKHEQPSELSELEEDAPPKKKAKKSKTKDDSNDAALAARLQAQMNNAARPTRGGGAKPVKSTPKKKAPKKKSAAKISVEDDSAVEDSSDDTKKTERGGAFNKPMYLSTPLQELLGEELLSRPKTVKGIWKHIKAHDLQNPQDKRQIICDEPLKAIFKKDNVHMFTMNKILSSHLTPVGG